MKYQIYLNKQTSELINKIAEKSNEKPATVIKKLVESFQTLAKPLEPEILKEVSKNENTKQ